MDTRYTTPEVARLFEPTWTYRSWVHILSMVAQEQAYHDVIPQQAADAIARHTGESLISPDDFPDPIDLAEIESRERQTQHDVAAFLSWWEARVSTRTSPGDKWGRYLAYGLTSSDLVDTTMGMRFKEANTLFWAVTNPLMKLLHDLGPIHMNATIIGHTHGQPAEPTRLGLVAAGWYDTMDRIVDDLHIKWGDCCIGKLSGPVGTYAHTPFQVAESVLNELGLQASHVAMQIVPRHNLSAWAQQVALMVDWIAKIALDFRLMASRGEAIEWYPEGRVGSSSMPHKVNPVRAEQLAGMARLAAGYADMLRTTQTWEQRDISHSSVERVAIPDLLHVLFHSIRSLTWILDHAQWDKDAFLQSGMGASRSPYSAWAALRAIDSGLSRPVAREAARRWVSGLVQEDGPVLPHEAPDWSWFARRHPHIDRASLTDG